MNVGTLKQWFLGWIKKEEKDGEKKDSSRYLRLILALGLAGMLLIGLSECSFGSQKTDALPANVSSESSTAAQDAAHPAGAAVAAGAARRWKGWDVWRS